VHDVRELVRVRLRSERELEANAGRVPPLVGEQFAPSFGESASKSVEARSVGMTSKPAGSVNSTPSCACR